MNNAWTIGLSATEIRALTLIMAGYKNKEIAARMSTTEQVVKNRVSHIMKKRDVRSRSQLVLKVLEMQKSGELNPTMPYNNKTISPSEQLVLELVLVGRSNKEVGNELGISEGTVKRHMYHIFEKTGCTSRLMLAVKCNSFINQDLKKSLELRKKIILQQLDAVNKSLALLNGEINEEVLATSFDGVLNVSSISSDNSTSRPDA